LPNLARLPVKSASIDTAILNDNLLSFRSCIVPRVECWRDSTPGFRLRRDNPRTMPEKSTTPDLVELALRDPGTARTLVL
jgi:hypothetical protein